MRGKALLMMVLACALALAACGGSSDETTDAQTRAVSGSLNPPAAIAVKAAKAADGPGTCTEIEPDICRVIATATDGTTVVDENLADCAFSLALVVGRDYVLSLVGPNAGTGACDQFVATLLSNRGSLFDIAEGDAIDLGLITINPDGTATFSGTYAGFLSCTDLGFEDADVDGACDGWDGDLPGEGDFSATACASNDDCGDGEYCATDIGYCFSDGYGACDSDDECEALFPGAGKICDPELYVCVGVPAEADVDQISGTYELAGSVNCVNPAVLPATETIAADADGVTMSTAVVDHTCHHNAASFELGTNLQATNVYLECLGNCIIDDTINTITFDVTAAPVNFTRKVTSCTANGCLDLAVNCEALYQKL